MSLILLFLLPTDKCYEFWTTWDDKSVEIRKSLDLLNGYQQIDFSYDGTYSWRTELQAGGWAAKQLRQELFYARREALFWYAIWRYSRDGIEETNWVEIALKIKTAKP